MKKIPENILDYQLIEETVERICGKGCQSVNQVIESAIMSWDLPDRVKKLSLSSYQYDEQDFSHTQLFVAENNQQIITGVYVLDGTDFRELADKEPAFLLHGIYVKSDSHRQGIGLALF